MNKIPMITDMKAQAKIPFVDTTIIPDRNAGIGSLLWDLQNPQDPDLDGRPLLGHEFAFIDVGASHAKVATTLKTLLVRDLGMSVEYVATELPEVVPYAYVTPRGDKAEKTRGYLSTMISSKETRRVFTDWHYVVDQNGRVSSVAYSYDHVGNEVWEAYFMGRSFMMSGEKIEFRNPSLDEMLAPDVQNIEAKIDLERKRENDTDQPGHSWEKYAIEKNPLEAGLAEFGIILQRTNVPQRITGKQNVLFLGNILNLYPQNEQAHELDTIAVNMLEGDLIIVQTDEMEKSYIEVLNVKGQGIRKTRERMRWINTSKLEVHKPGPDPGSWQHIHLKPVLERIKSKLLDCIWRREISPDWSQEELKVMVHQYVSHVFATFFRALPVEDTLRIAIREALRRIPSKGGLKGIPVFSDDEQDVYGGALGLNPEPIVSDADLIKMMMASANVERTLVDNINRRNKKT
jgi:hypothetical protein